MATRNAKWGNICYITRVRTYAAEASVPVRFHGTSDAYDGSFHDIKPDTHTHGAFYQTRRHTGYYTRHACTRGIIPDTQTHGIVYQTRRHTGHYTRHADTRDIIPDTQAHGVLYQTRRHTGH